MTTLTTLVNFTYATGSSPDGSLIFDTAGDLLGTPTNVGPMGQNLARTMRATCSARRTT